MASRPSPNSLIHCAACGEDYSATYKRCPFCGAKNMPPFAPGPASFRSNPDENRSGRRPADPDDTYVFDGQDLFDGDPDDDYTPVRSKGGKRLAEKPSSSPFASAEINWPRMITFLCSLIIIIAAMVIVFTVIYPQLRAGKDPAADSTGSPSAAATNPAGDTTQPVAPAASDPVSDVTDPPVESDPGDPPVDPNGLSTISFRGAHDDDFTLQPDESHTITLNFDPADWAGAVSWTSSNPEYATVDASGKVTNVNATDQLHTVTITVSAEGLSLESKVYCRGRSAEPPATDSPAQTDPPAAQTPSGSGIVTVGARGTIVGADGGLRVRSGPGTNYSVLATLVNGRPVNVVSDAGGGWYEITFSGSGGTTVTGYIMGDYISTD